MHAHKHTQAHARAQARKHTKEQMDEHGQTWRTTWVHIMRQETADWQWKGEHRQGGPVPRPIKSCRRKRRGEGAP